MASAFQSSAFQNNAFQIDAEADQQFTGGRRHGTTTYAPKTRSRIEREKLRAKKRKPELPMPAPIAPVMPFELSDLVLGSRLSPSVTFRPLQEDEDEALVLLLAA